MKNKFNIGDIVVRKDRPTHQHQSITYIFTMEGETYYCLERQSTGFSAKLLRKINKKPEYMNE